MTDAVAEVDIQIDATNAIKKHERKITMVQTTPCIRCGKDRIISKTWTEKIGESKVVRTDTVCPDPECQKIVEEQLQVRNDRMRQVQEQSLKRRANFRRKKVDIVLK